MLMNYLLSSISTKIHNAWQDYYSGMPEIYITGLIGVNYSITQNCMAHSCVFEDINGGCIIMEASETKLLVDQCTFKNCYRLNDGGAIYFGAYTNEIPQNPEKARMILEVPLGKYYNGHCIIRKTCAYLCHTSDSFYGQFAYAHTGVNSPNFVDECAVCKCDTDGKAKTTRYSSIYINNGNISVKNLNSTFNFCAITSGIDLTMGTIDSQMSYSSFFNNTASLNQLVEMNGGYCSVKYSNFYYNTQKSTEVGLIYGVECTVEFEFCSFYENSYLFLFEASSGNMLIVNSVLYDSSGIKTYTYTGSVTNINCSFTAKPNIIHHLNTGVCVPFWASLIPSGCHCNTNYSINLLFMLFFLITTLNFL